MFTASLLVSCENVPKVETQKLNGYWEIEKVILADGSEKDYKINMTYDFFKIDKNYKGFRKKVSPQLDGKFLADDSSEALEVIDKDGKIVLNLTMQPGKKN